MPRLELEIYEHNNESMSALITTALDSLKSDFTTEYHPPPPPPRLSKH